MENSSISLTNKNFVALVLFRILAHYGCEKLSDDNVYEPLIGPSAENMLFSGPKMSE